MLAENVLLDGKTVLVTGAAGFIGSNLAKRLLQGRLNVRVVGVDNMNDYYDVRLKEERLKELSDYPSFVFIKGDISDKATVDGIFDEYKPQVVVNLAAQAGVRYSISNPDAYICSNIIGFYNILEACRHSYDNGQPGLEHLVYASPGAMIAIKTIKRRICQHNEPPLPNELINLIIVHGVPQRTRSANQNFSHTVEIDIFKQERRFLSRFVIEKQYSLRTSDLRIENILPALIVPSGS